MRYLLFALLVAGCCAPRETTIEDRQIPIPGFDIQKSKTDTLWLPADTAKILEMYCQGEAHGTDAGVSWDVSYGVSPADQIRLVESERDSLGRIVKWFARDSRTKVATIKNLNVKIQKADSALSYRDTTKIVRPIINEYSFWDKVQLAFFWLVVGGVVSFAGMLLLKSRFPFT